jgi:hypothetical protein
MSKNNIGARVCLSVCTRQVLDGHGAGGGVAPAVPRGNVAAAGDAGRAGLPAALAAAAQAGGRRLCGSAAGAGRCASCRLGAAAAGAGGARPPTEVRVSLCGRGWGLGFLAFGVSLHRLITQQSWYFFFSSLGSPSSRQRALVDAVLWVDVGLSVDAVLTMSVRLSCDWRRLIRATAR